MARWPSTQPRNGCFSLLEWLPLCQKGWLGPARYWLPQSCGLAGWAYGPARDWLPDLCFYQPCPPYSCTLSIWADKYGRGFSKIILGFQNFEYAFFWVWGDVWRSGSPGLLFEFVGARQPQHSICQHFQLLLEKGTVERHHAMEIMTSIYLWIWIRNSSYE